MGDEEPPFLDASDRYIHLAAEHLRETGEDLAAQDELTCLDGDEELPVD